MEWDLKTEKRSAMELAILALASVATIVQAICNAIVALVPKH